MCEELGLEYRQSPTSAGFYYIPTGECVAELEKKGSLVVVPSDLELHRHVNASVCAAEETLVMGVGLGPETSVTGVGLGPRAELGGVAGRVATLRLDLDRRSAQRLAAARGSASEPGQSSCEPSGALLGSRLVPGLGQCTHNPHEDGNTSDTVEAARPVVRPQLYSVCGEVTHFPPSPVVSRYDSELREWVSVELGELRGPALVRDYSLDSVAESYVLEPEVESVEARCMVLESKECREPPWMLKHELEGHPYVITDICRPPRSSCSFLDMLI